MFCKIFLIPTDSLRKKKFSSKVCTNAYILQTKIKFKIGLVLVTFLCVPLATKGLPVNTFLSNKHVKCFMKTTCSTSQRIV